MKIKPWIIPLILSYSIIPAKAIWPLEKNDKIPQGFVDVKKMIPDIILDIRYVTANNFVGEVLDGFKAPRAFLLPEVALALKRAQAQAKKLNLLLKIFDAYRPLRSEWHMVRWAKKNKKENLLTEGYVPTYISPKRQVGHTSGNTVDLTLADNLGNELDMGTAFDEFSKKCWTQNARGLVLQNRLLLKKIMESEGFKNYYREWWHFVYAKAPSNARDEIIR